MNDAPIPSLFTANPSERGDQWFVWDMYLPMPPKPVFAGSMEECGAVRDVLNSRLPLGDMPFGKDHPND